MFATTLVLMALAQDPPAGAGPTVDSTPDAEPAAEVITPRARAATLRDRIHGLRRDLLGGGTHVKKAEQEALDFYKKKNVDFQRRLDGVRADLVASRTEYETFLDSTLTADTSKGASAAAREARRKGQVVQQLADREQNLVRQREVAQKNVTAVQNRLHTRERLLERFDADIPDFETMAQAPGVDVFTDELAPDNSNPFDRSLLLDLAQRDPLRAREIVLREDPQLYPKLWPATPPPEVFRSLLKFPLRDLPGQR